jgi:imidazolonepropionase-like amidohydrolase
MPDHSDSSSGLVAFTGGRLIDGCGNRVENATVLIEKDRIQAVAPAVEITLPETARRYDITGKTIMPGLIDTHVHIGNIEVSMDKTARLAPAVYVHLASRNLENDLDLGFTTLRDAGGLDQGFREAVNLGLISGPRLLLSVSPLTPTGGHFDQREADQSANRPRNSIGIFPEICDGPDAVRKSAREVLRKGADQVKIAADGGVSSPTDEPGHWQFGVAEMQAAVEIAEAAGTYVMAHAYDPVAIRHCVKAGVRTIEHGNLLDAETADLMASNEVYYVPTLATYDVLANESRHELDAHTTAKLEMVSHTAQSAVAHARRAGVKIGSGSDIIGPYQHLKGRELRLKAEVMSPMEAIVSATRINAEIVCLDDRIGTLEPGKIADLIVVDGNPLEDLNLFERGAETILLVMKAGSIMKNLLSS